MRVARLFLVRHTRPAVTADICYGRTDVALAQTSGRDIESSLQSIPRCPRISSSPAGRCRRLATALGRRDSVEVLFDPRLLELDFGVWEGRRWIDVPRADIDAWNADLINVAPGGGETLAALWQRAGEFLEAVAHASQDLVAVSHHGPIRAIAARLLGEPPQRLFDRQFPWGSVTEFGLTNALLKTRLR